MELLEEIKALLTTYSSHVDKINLKVKWGANTTREDKLNDVISLFLEKNLKPSREKQEILIQLRKHLQDDDLKQVLNRIGYTPDPPNCSSQQESLSTSPS